jgi:uncharacterized RDD family membrane protein YckC
MEGNNDPFSGKMKCKRCRAYVSDDSNVCPMCGEDLTFLRELLKSVYEEDPKPAEPQPAPGSSGEPSQETRPDPSAKAGEPRVILNSEPIDLGADYRVTFSMTDGFGGEEPAADSEPSPPWDYALRGGFWRRMFAFEVDLLLLFLLLGIFIISGFIAAEWGSGDAGTSLLKQARVIFPLILPLAVVLAVVYFSFFHAAWGQTIGKMIFRVRVIQAGGQPLTFPLALLRTFAYLVSAFPAFLGFIWAGFTAGKRAWHDWLAGTIVVREQ